MGVQGLFCASVRGEEVRQNKIFAWFGMAAFLVSGYAVTDRKNKLAVATATVGAAGASIGRNMFGAGSSTVSGALALGGK